MPQKTQAETRRKVCKACVLTLQFTLNQYTQWLYMESR
jgi:hypothetical protein